VSIPAKRNQGRGWRTASRAIPIVAAAVVFVVAWQLLVSLTNYPAFILPGPAAVLNRLISAWANGTIEPHAFETLTEVLLGIAVGGAVGVAMGIVLARWSVAERLLSPYLVAAQATPILALAPLIYLWFGSGLGSRVLICSLIVFFPIAVSTMVGFRSVDAKLIELARSLRASHRQILWTFEIPGALPQILGGFRVGVTLAVVGAIVAEWAGADRGLGVLINLARGSLFDTALLFATLITIAGIGIVLYLVVALIERVLLGPWRSA
jgi:NitT/TauT family transport system permease protein